MPILETKLGKIKGIERASSYQYLGIPYAKAERFSYAKPIDTWTNTLDATEWGPSCVQKRLYYPHFEIPMRMFYHKESRANVPFTYSEDCQILNIWTPKEKGKYPVMVWIHGGGFDSGCTHDPQFDGAHLAARGVVVVTIQYRVGPFGYLCHEQIEKENGHDGNFGLDDQLVALKWIKRHIEDFSGDKDNITLFGQSAGAVSIQLLSVMKETVGLYSKAIMMSGGGWFPLLNETITNEKQRVFTHDLMKLTNCNSFEEFKNVDCRTIYDALEKIGSSYKNVMPYMMPVIDNYHLKGTIEELLSKPNKLKYMLSFTSKDIFTLHTALGSLKYAKANNAYTYFFDIPAKGDNAMAFHSSDLRYIFGTLESSWRPYDSSDYEASRILMSYATNFAKTGNPNGTNLPLWEKSDTESLVFTSSEIKMGKVDLELLEKNEKITTI